MTPRKVKAKPSQGKVMLFQKRNKPQEKQGREVKRSCLKKKQNLKKKAWTAFTEVKSRYFK
jgi:hypothetical protein